MLKMCKPSRCHYQRWPAATRRIGKPNAIRGLTETDVDALAGFSYTPDAVASAPVITAGKKFAVITNAGTSFITNLSPYFVRTSFTLWQSS